MTKKHCDICMGSGAVQHELEAIRKEYNSKQHQDCQIYPLSRRDNSQLWFAKKHGYDRVPPEYVACLDCDGTGIVQC